MTVMAPNISRVAETAIASTTMQMPGTARRQGNRIGPRAAAAAASSRTRAITAAAKPEEGSMLSACAATESGGPKLRASMRSNSSPLSIADITSLLPA